MIILPDTEETETEHLNDLGLHAEALGAIERELKTRQDKETLWQAVATALSNKRYQLAVEYAELLKKAPGVEKRHIQLVKIGRAHV